MHFTNICHSQNSTQTQAKYAADRSLFTILMQYKTFWGKKNVIIYLDIHNQEHKYGMHKIVKEMQTG
jgi:hypothetical protein